MAPAALRWLAAPVYFGGAVADQLALLSQVSVLRHSIAVYPSCTHVVLYGTMPVEALGLPVVPAGTELLLTGGGGGGAAVLLTGGGAAEVVGFGASDDDGTGTADDDFTASDDDGTGTADDDFGAQEVSMYGGGAGEEVTMTGGAVYELSTQTTDEVFLPGQSVTSAPQEVMV